MFSRIWALEAIGVISPVEFVWHMDSDLINKDGGGVWAMALSRFGAEAQFLQTIAFKWVPWWFCGCVCVGLHACGLVWLTRVVAWLMCTVACEAYRHCGLAVWA